MEMELLAVGGVTLWVDPYRAMQCTKDLLKQENYIQHVIISFRTL